MKQTRLFLGMFLVSASALSWACSSDDSASGTTTTTDAGMSDIDAGVTGADASTALACGNATGAPPRALAILGSYSARTSGKNELAAINLTTNAVDGRYPYEGEFATIAATGTEPYLLDETKDTVTRFDALEPWKPVASWDVHGTDADGGDPTANPIGLVAASCTKAYVLRYNRNAIAVIDQSQAADGGAPVKYIDLSSLVQTTDSDGTVEPTAAVYVAAKRRVYVLLGNFDHPLAARGACPTETLTPSLVAIDVDTDQIVSLGGTAPGGGIALPGYSPVSGSPLIYDAADDRVLALNLGCSSGVATLRRGVDAVSLTTNTATTLLDLNNADYPTTFAFLDSNHAAVAFYGSGRLWDPTQTSLGTSIPQGIDTVATDGRGGFVATHQTKLSDKGPELDVVTFPGDGGAERLVTTNPFTVTGDYVSGLASWPHP